jgi:metal-responsive CopG/Arc/MetJ family transcriptional regulator
MARPLRLTARFITKLEPELLARLDAWCAAAGMKRAEAVRLAIERVIKTRPMGKSDLAAAAVGVSVSGLVNVKYRGDRMVEPK